MSGMCYTELTASKFVNVALLRFFPLCKIFRNKVLWPIGTRGNRAIFKALSETLTVHSECHSLRQSALART